MIPVPVNTRVWLAAGVTPAHTCKHVLPGNGHAAWVHDADHPLRLADIFGLRRCGRQHGKNARMGKKPDFARQNPSVRPVHI
jgi:hypothetical protein